MSGLSYEFTDKDVSPWGGLRLVGEVYRKSGLKGFLEDGSPDLPVPGSNRGYSSLYLIEGFMVSVILGAKRLAHAGTLRYDKVVQCIFDWKRGMASQSTFSRFFRKFDQELNDKVFPSINRFWFSQMKMDNLTIDFDSTVLVRHGIQEGVEVGYNPKKAWSGIPSPTDGFCCRVEDGCQCMDAHLG